MQQISTKCAQIDKRKCFHMVIQPLLNSCIHHRSPAIQLPLKWVVILLDGWTNGYMAGLNAWGNGDNIVCKYFMTTD